MFVVTVILAIVVGGGFTMMGAAKLARQEMMEESRKHLSVSASLWKTIGGLEVAGGLGVLAGLHSSLPIIGVLAGIGLVLMMAGAIWHHQKVGDVAKDMVPAMAMAALSIVYIIVRTASSG